jgi:hypothetical protein
MMPSEGGEVVRERCPNCGYEFSPSSLLRASKSRFLLCPKCRRAFRKLSDVSVLDGVGLISTRRDLRRRSREYLSYACQRLGISQGTEEMAWSVLVGYNRDWGTRTAVGGALYLACLLTRERHAQNEIASVLKLTEVAVRLRYVKIAKHLNINRYALLGKVPPVLAPPHRLASKKDYP